MAKTSQRILDRRGKVAAPDIKYTGQEPEWKDAETISYDEYNKRLSRGLRFYGYYCDNKICKEWVLQWMKKVGYNKETIDIIKSLPPSSLPSTAGKLARMLDQGMPAEHPDEMEIYNERVKNADDLEVIEKQPSRDQWIKNLLKDVIDNNIDYYNLSDDEDKKVVKKKVISPMTRINNKVNDEIINPLDGLLDDIINISTDTSPAKIPTMDIGSLLRGNKIPGNGVKLIIAWLQEKLYEFQSAYDKTDEDMVEGYSWLRKPQLGRIIKNFEKMIDDTKTYSKSKVKTRKPRVKKPKAVDKQVSRLKYLEESDDYQIKSVDATNLPFSQRALFFNTKNRQLSIYYASGHAGFEIKGTTLQGFDKDRSVIMTLRKPEDFLPKLLSATPKGLDKVLSTLTTKPRKGNGRINANMIILRTLNTI